MKKNKKEKPYKCMYCGRRFADPCAHKCKDGFRKHHLFSILPPKNEMSQILLEDTPSQSELNKPLKFQVGGNHYKKYKIQPIEFAMANGLDACQTNILKYIMRHKDKNGKEDLLKARHYLDMMIDYYYPTK